MSLAPLVVSNTTPISNLIRIQRLPLLAQLFGQVVIPTQVAAELDRGEHVLGPWRQAPGASSIVVEAPLDGPFLRQLLVRLDDGEAAAIALATERRAPLLLMDELEGRRVAVYHGVKIAGTLAILLDAKRRGVVEQVRPLVDALERANFRISAALKAQVLADAGEG
ncbi:MAG TPA: DUF3368 domain-containing protein [Candidatus Nanopelagicales bacterium]|nr:DUF3368 domain-containing protein [Candidatus Nanopelagicales bacterium]